MKDPRTPERVTFTVRPLTLDLWPALEDLFGKGGASNGCWCMYWRLGPEYHKRPREKNRRALRSLVRRGPPPGLLAFDGERPVGWCQLTPRDDLDWLNRKAAFERVDTLPVWSISCFYVRRGYRGKGVMGRHNAQRHELLLGPGAGVELDRQVHQLEEDHACEQ